MDTNKMRAAFEATILKDGKSIRRCEDSYHFGTVHRKWLFWKAAWQSAREAVVVRLPEPYAVVGDYAACGGGRMVWDCEYAEKITDHMCQKTPVYDRASLESAGLKVAP